MRRTAFTLIELLVVVAIIAVLAGILLPAVGLVRDASRKVACAGNLRQVGTGLYAYMIDYHSAPWGLTPDSDWRTTLASAMDVALPSRSFSCPAVATGIAPISHFSGQNGFFPWIVTNWTPGAGTVIPGSQRDLRPDFAIVYDGTQYSDGTTSAYPIAWNVGPTWGWLEWNDHSAVDLGNPADGPGSYNISFRHRGTANYLFGDMRVESERSNALTVSDYRITKGGRKYGWE